MADRAGLIIPWLSRLAPEAGCLAELRALHLPGARAKSAYFRLPDQAAEMAAQAIVWEDAGAVGVYWTMNPVKADMAQARASARDADVAARRFLLVDIDPCRPASVCSTAAEKKFAMDMVRDVVAGLEEFGFCKPVVADSGNGYHLLYPINLPNDEPSKVRVQAFLRGLDQRLSSDQVKIDTSVFNASRIVRVWGTLTRKGDDTDDRPWRRSAMLTMPAERLSDEALAKNILALTEALRVWAWIEEQRTGRPTRERTTRTKTTAVEATTPVGDDFDKRATWTQVLAPHGWRVDREADGVTYWTRPGKDDGTSATTGHCTGQDGADLLYIFSNNAEPLKPGPGYGKFRAFSVLDHGGDNAAAAKELAGQGYGEQKQAETPPATKDQPLRPPVTAADLLATDFPEPACIVPGLVPIGLTLLAGRPKQGKSFWALQLAVAAATASNMLGTEALPGDVLYLALEDHDRRIQSRLKKFLGAPPYSAGLSRLSFLFANGVKAGDLGPIHAWAKEAKRPRLVVLDTLGRFMPVKRREGDSYQADYAFMAELQKVAFALEVAFVVVHHTRKVVADDPLTEVSGSTAYTGAADAVLVLRRNRGEKDATLEVTGRDIEEASLKIQWNDGVWSRGGGGCQAAGPRRMGPAPEKLQAACDWLRAQLAAGPRKVAELRELAEGLDDPIPVGTLYNAMRTLGLEQYGTSPKYWRMPDPEDTDK